MAQISGGTKFKVKKTGRSKDPSDIGFVLEGLKLFWAGARQMEDKPGRIWTPLRKGDLDESTIKAIREVRPMAFEKGDTIRWHELVLCYAPLAQVAEEKAEKERAAKDQLNLIHTGPQSNAFVKTDRKETTVDRVNSVEDFKQ